MSKKGTIPGNSAALREALKGFLVGGCVYPCVTEGYDELNEECGRCTASPQEDGDCPYEKARLALAAKPRRCDLMTEEQLIKFVTRYLVPRFRIHPAFNIVGGRRLVEYIATEAIKCAYATRLKSNKKGTEK